MPSREFVVPSVAIIGSGVSGLSAAYALRHTHDITLFERDTRFGGHAHTHSITGTDDLVRRVDTGFIVHNERTYPNLLRIFSELGIATQETEMSMSVRCASCGLAYAGGRGLPGLFAQPRRALDARYLRMLSEVPRFHRAARTILARDSEAELTWGEFLQVGHYSSYFIRHFAVPLVSCVWSSGDEDTLRYPARHLFEFLDHHGLLSVGNSPTWRTVVGGSATYVDAIVKQLPDARTGVGVRAVQRHNDGVDVTLETGETTRFDSAIIATHADDAFQMLTDATPGERADLGSIPYSRNTTWLHRDDSVLPVEPGARASWNYAMDSCDGGSSAVLVTYWMNHLQRLQSPDQYMVTLNPAGRVDESTVLKRMEYAHPVFTRVAVAAAERLRASGGPRLAFAGAHLGWGFHEDGARSGIEAALKFGAQW